MNTTVIDMDAALQTFLDSIQLRADLRHAKHYPNVPTPQYQIKRGSKYAKIYAKGQGVFCFVDLTNGDVLKAASWAAPAKHARGNIFNVDNGMDAVTDYGAKYL